MKRALSLISLLIPATIMSGTDYANAQAQWQWMPDPCGGYSDQWSANCRRDSRGNMIDGNTGNTYDPYGNPIRRNSGTRNRTVNPSRSNRPDEQACSLAKQYVLEHGSPSSGPFERYQKAHFYYLDNCQKYFGPL
jgi:hypothetical protein